MYPYLIRIGGLSLPAYPLFCGLGIAIAGTVAMWLGRRDGIDPRKMAHLMLLTGALMLVGGRLFYVVQDAAYFQGHLLEAIDLSAGGQVLYGGLVLASIGILVFARAAHMRLGPMLDAVSVGAPLGLVFGRIGCFCRGCCHGRLTDLPWGVTFPPHVDLQGRLVGSEAFMRHVEAGLILPSAQYSAPVHPSQLYSAAASLMVFAIMLWLWRSRRLSGRLVFVYVWLYCAVRFGLELTRDNKMAFGCLTVPQVVSPIVFAVAMSAFLLLRGWRRHARVCLQSA